MWGPRRARSGDKPWAPGIPSASGYPVALRTLPGTVTGTEVGRTCSLYQGLLWHTCVNRRPTPKCLRTRLSLQAAR